MGLALIGGLLLAACGQDDGPLVADGKLQVAASTVQITALTREVGGDTIDLKGLIPAGADPHEFEPTASDLTAIESASLILRHGMDLDSWLDDTLKTGKNARVVTVTSGIKLLKGEEDGKKIDDPVAPDHGFIATHFIRRRPEPDVESEAGVILESPEIQAS